ncbi:RNA recognition motif domain-containing protein [Ditylenchus destructor]|nr:RNA recognition motif domain-containing protein [Ditylenchus destructor]
MSSFRNILLRCARNASILGRTPLQIQCASTFNPVTSDPTSISRRAYSSDANEAPKNGNDPVQKYFLEMMNAKKARPNATKDQKASMSIQASKDQKVSKRPTFNKNLNLRKYYIGINGLSNETTPESLREFYSQFGEIMDRALNTLPHCIDGKETEFGRLNNCWIKYGTTVGEVTFAQQEDMHRALDAQPHVIDGLEVFLQYATNDLEFKIDDIPEGITEEELIALYSKYGQLRRCRLFRGKSGISNAFVSYSAVNELNRAIDDRPHIINGKPLQIKFLGKRHFISVSLFVGSLPENVTEETLHEEFSKYGKPVYWELRNDWRFNQSTPYGIVSYASQQEALNALNSGPHTIEGVVVDVRKAKEVRPSSREKSYD